MVLRVVFAGTPDFSVPALEKMVADSSCEVVGVYTQPDRPAGRGRKLTPSPVKQMALKHNIPVEQPATLRKAEFVQVLAEYRPDVIVVIAYGLLLPKGVLELPTHGCINVHASLLPRWRGAAPIQSSILAGDAKTGVTIMQMDEGLDTGDMLLVRECEISQTDTSANLHDRLAEMGTEALLKVLGQIEEGSLQPVAQDNAQANYAHKIKKSDAQIDWSSSAQLINQTIRAYNPWPIAFTHFDGKVARIWQAVVLPENTDLEPGTLVAMSKSGLEVATGSGILRITQLQLPGGKVQKSTDFVNAHRNFLQEGQRCFI